MDVAANNQRCAFVDGHFRSRGVAMASAALSGGGLALVFGDVGAGDWTGPSRDAIHGGSLYLCPVDRHFHDVGLEHSRGLAALAATRLGLWRGYGRGADAVGDVHLGAITLLAQFS